MHSACSFLSGPGLVLSLAVFFCGLAWRVIWYLRGLDWQLDRVAYKPHLKRGLLGALDSIVRWLLPFGTRSWRQAPVFSAAFFLFHGGAVLVPLFLAGHGVLLHESVGFSLPSMPQKLADTLTAGALMGAALLLARRLALTEVRILSARSDYAVWALAAAPLLTGFLACMRAPGYEFWLLLHMFSGELLLVLAPFTKLSHIVLFFLSRGQLGMDYSIKRGGEWRGPCFPW
jgi:nitrate reductase gamma subunit